MAVFQDIPLGEKGLREVYGWLDGFVEKNGKIAHKQVLGQSENNWDIPAVFVTNKDIEDDDK